MSLYLRSSEREDHPSVNERRFVSEKSAEITARLNLVTKFQIAANQLNIKSLGLTTRKRRSINKRLTAYAKHIIAVPENQWPLPATKIATILKGSTRDTGIISRSND